jgi:hypothetical protein
MQQFSAGAVLSRSFSIWLKNIIPFTILTLLVYSPLILYTLLVLGGDMTLKGIETWGRINGLLGYILSLVATAALTYGTFQQLRGRHAGIGESIGVGLKRLLPVLGVGILAGLCVVGGLILLIVPGFIVMCMLWVAVPVAVVERPGVGASLKRSAELTKGSRWHIFGIVIVLAVINGIVNYILQSSFVENATSMTDIKVYMFLALMVSILFGSLQAVCSAVGYHDLRESKEGVGIEELAKVFD